MEFILLIILIILIASIIDSNKSANKLRAQSESVNRLLAQREQEKRKEKMSFAKIDQMEGHEFEQWCAWLLSYYGFSNITITPGSGDQGVDIIAIKNEQRYAIQCKRYKNALSNKPIQEVYTGMQIYNCSVGIVMTNSYFTAGGREAAKATGILLWDRNSLYRMITGIKKFEEQKEEEKRRKEIEAQNAKSESAQSTIEEDRSSEQNQRNTFSGVMKSLFFCTVIMLLIIGAVYLIKYSSSGKQNLLSSQSTDYKKLIDAPLYTLEDFKFGMSQMEVERMFKNKGITLIDENYEKSPEAFEENIVAPGVYPEVDHSDVCVNEFAYPDSFKYLGQNVDAIRLYFAYDRNNNGVIHGTDHSMLYAVKFTILSEMPQEVFQTMDKAIEDECGVCTWKGMDITQLYGNKGSTTVQNDLEYHIWRLEQNKTIIALAGKSENTSPNNGDGDVEISIISSYADNLINWE